MANDQNLNNGVATQFRSGEEAAGDGEKVLRRLPQKRNSQKWEYLMRMQIIMPVL
jgi:hypothetical protein